MDRFIPYSQPGAYGITTELWRVQRDGSLIERVDPEHVGTVTVTCNENVPVKRTATVATDEPNAYRPFVDFLMPYLTVSDPEGNTITGPQGLYMVVPSSTSTEAAGSTGDIECRDLSQLLVMATLDNAVCPAGTDRGAYCRQLAFDMGFPQHQVQIPDFGVLQAEDRVWEPGTTVHQVMTDMAVGSNHYQPWFDNYGRLVSLPYAQLTEIAPTHHYTNATDDAAAEIEGAINETPDWNRLANRVTVRKIGDAETPTIWYTATNENPESPVSFPTLGFWIPKVVDNPDIEDEAAAETQAKQLLSESAAHYIKVSLPSFPVVDAELHQTIGLDITRGSESVFNGTFIRTGYTLTLDGGNTGFLMELARVETWQ